jgi:vancomycin aglycone glucosyltransferase
MRVLLTATGSRGDVQPLVAVASRLRTAGHQACLCVPQNYCAWVDGLGFPAAPIAPLPWRRSGTGGREPEVSSEQVRDAIADQFAVLHAAARGCDAIMAAAVLPAARSVAETLGIRYVFAAFCPLLVPSPYHAPLPASADQDRLPTEAENLASWARQRERLNSRLLLALNCYRELAGLRPVDDVMDHVLTDRPWLNTDRLLAPWPGDGDAVEQTGAWVLDDDRRLPGDLEAFLAAGEPPVYFGFGSMPMPAEVTGVLVRAARQVGRRAVISGGQAGLALAGPEPDCLVIGDVNLRALFGQVAAVAHHGGAGTTTVAALAGVPQVVVPQRFDQPYWAARVRDLGIGVAHAPGVPGEDSLAKAFGQVLEPQVAARAASVAAAMTKDGARTAADDLARSGRPQSALV